MERGNEASLSEEEMCAKVWGVRSITGAGARDNLGPGHFSPPPRPSLWSKPLLSVTWLAAHRHYARTFWNPHNTPEQKCFHYPHFKEEETEGHRAELGLMERQDKETLGAGDKREKRQEKRDAECPNLNGD